MVGALVGLLGGCGGEPALRADPSARGQPAASVNGEPIALTEVEGLARATGLSPREALSRLVGERLLVQHAEAGGYGELPAVKRELERARVRALLTEAVEREVPASDVEGRARRLASLIEALRRETNVRFDDAGLGALLAGAQSR